MKKAFVGMGIMAFLLTGCAGEVNLSDVDNVRVAQYAADLVLKYDSNYKERLLTEEEAKEAREKLRLAAEKEAKLQELLAAKENAKKGSTGQKQENETTDGETTNSAAPAIKYNVNDALHSEGFQISRAGYEVLDEYNDATEETSMFVDVQASVGKKLLVTKYEITNTSDTLLECNFFSKDISGSVVINGSINVDSMVTMLLNDLGTYKTEIEAGATKEAVLIFEIPENAATVQQLELTLHVGNESFVIE